MFGVKKQKTRKFRSLAVTLTAAFLMLSVGFLVIATITGLSVNFQAQKKRIISEQQLIAQDTARTVSDFVEDKLRDLDQAADINSLATNPDRHAIVLSKLLDRTPSFRQLFFTDATGQVLKKVSRHSTWTESPLDEWKKPMFSEILKGNSFMSQVYTDSSTSEPLILVAVPAHNLSGEPAGALIAEMNLKFMWDLISKIEIGREGLAYVIDRGGTLIAFRDSNRVLNRERVASLKEPNRFVLGINDSDADISRGILGGYVVSQYKPLIIPDWAVVVELPVVEAYASVLQTLWYSLGVMALLGALLAVISGKYFSKRITREILSLSQAVEAISQGKLDTQVETLSHNEIGQLGASFNVMAGKLKEFYTGLEDKVAEQNHELSQEVSETKKSRSAILNLLEDVEEEKKKAERILHFLESIHEAVYATDINREIIFVNPAAAAIIGSSREKILGTHTTEHFFFEVNVGELVERKSPVKEVLTQQKPFVFAEHTFVVQKKKRIPIAGTAAPILDENKKLTGVIVVFRDITEKYDLEQMKEGFLSVAAHQLRTPLGSMRWSMELLLNGDLGEITKDAKEVVTQLYDNSQRMLTLVNDLLDVSRIDQKRGLEEKKPVDVVSLFNDVIKALAGEAEKRSVSVSVKPVSAPIPPILVSSQHVYEAFENMIVNGIKYNKQGGSVTVSIEKRDSGLHIEIADTGIGIPEAAQSKMFSRFFRAPNAVLKETEGSGLGLSVVKSYLEEAGATVRFESEEGKGTTFFIDFPPSVAEIPPSQTA